MIFYPFVIIKAQPKNLEDNFCTFEGVCFDIIWFCDGETPDEITRKKEKRH